MLTEDLITYEQVEALIDAKPGQWFHPLPPDVTAIGLTRNGEWPVYCSRCVGMVLQVHGLDPAKYTLRHDVGQQGYHVVRKVVSDEGD